MGQKQRPSLKTDAVFRFVSRLAISEEARRCRTSSRFGGPKEGRMKAEDAFSVRAGAFRENDDPLFGLEERGDFPSNPREVGSMRAAQVKRARPTAKHSNNGPVPNFAFADENTRRNGGDHDDVKIAEVVGCNKPPFGNPARATNAEAQDLRESPSVRPHPFLAILAGKAPALPQADAVEEKPSRPDREGAELSEKSPRMSQNKSHVSVAVDNRRERKIGQRLWRGRSIAQSASQGSFSTCMVRRRGTQSGQGRRNRRRPPPNILANDRINASAIPACLSSISNKGSTDFSIHLEALPNAVACLPVLLYFPKTSTISGSCLVCALP